MKTLLSFIALAVLGTVSLFGSAAAETVRIHPESTVAAAVGETTRAALKFDLGEVEEIESAYLELDLTGVSDDSRSEFNLFLAEEDWSDAGDVSGLTLSEEPLSSWDIEILDYQRVGGFVRFDITDTVKSWMTNEYTNAGVIIVTGDMSAGSLSGQLPVAVLVIRD